MKTSGSLAFLVDVDESSRVEVWKKAISFARGLLFVVDGIYSKRHASKPSRPAGLLSNGDFRVKTWIQNILFLSSFYMAHKAVFVFDIIELQRRQVFRLAWFNFDCDQG